MYLLTFENVFVRIINVKLCSSKLNFVYFETTPSNVIYTNIMSKQTGTGALFSGH